MSYILEALKKSEQERHQQHQVPSIQAVHTPIVQTTKRLVWPWILSIVISLNAIVLALIWLKPFDNDLNNLTSSKPAPTSDNNSKNYKSTSVNVSRSAPALTTPESNPDVISYSPDSQPITPPPESSTNNNQTQSTDTLTENTLSPATDETDGWLVIKPKQKTQGISSDNDSIESTDLVKSEFDNPDNPLTSEITSDIEGGVIITPNMNAISELGQKSIPTNALVNTVAFNQLPTAVRQSLPDLEFSGHIYSSDPRFRRVMINGTKYREGATILNSIVLNEITPDGVIMSAQGYTFQIDVGDLF